MRMARRRDTQGSFSLGGRIRQNFLRAGVVNGLKTRTMVTAAVHCCCAENVLEEWLLLPSHVGCEGRREGEASRLHVGVREHGVIHRGNEDTAMDVGLFINYLCEGY